MDMPRRETTVPPETCCEQCGKVIAPENINTIDGVGYCRACDFATPLVDPQRVEVGDADATMPAGCWWRDDGVEQEAGAVMRRPFGVLLMLFGGVFGGVPLTLFLASVNVGRRRGPSGGGAPMDWTIAAVFTAVGSMMLIAGIVLVCGTVRVVMRDGAARAISGLWPLRLARPFNIAAVREVRIVDSGARSNGRIMYAVGVRTKKWIKFGAALREDRRKWLAATLAKRLVARKR